MKEDLIHWVSCVVKKALIESNVKKGVSATAIRSSNLSNMASKMGPSGLEKDMMMIMHQIGLHKEDIST